MREQLQIVTHRADRLEAGDRRRAPRVEVRLKVEFSERDSHYQFQGVVTDISRTGMRIRTVGQIRLHNDDELRFWVYAGGSMIRVKGHVVRRPSTEEIAIAFDATNTPTQTKVEDVVEETAVKNLRFETVVRRYDSALPRDRGSLSAQAHELSRQHGMTFHDGVAAAKRDKSSVGLRWLSRRRNSHFDEI